MVTAMGTHKNRLMRANACASRERRSATMLKHKSAMAPEGASVVNNTRQISSIANEKPIAAIAHTLTNVTRIHYVDSKHFLNPFER